MKKCSAPSRIEPLESRIAPAFAASISLGALNGIDGFKLPGVADGDSAGRWVSRAGDVNGDGFADLLIGAPSANEGGTDRGAAYVVFGKAGGFGASVALSAIDGSNGFKLSGVADSDFSGRSVSAAGDVNGDGFADLLIGAFGANEGGLNRGAAYVVFGKAGGFGASVALSGLNGSNGFALSGVANGDYAGTTVSAAGDVNGDGFADLFIGAATADEGGTFRGAGYVVFGQAGGFGASVALSGLNGSNGFKLSGVADGNYAGTSVSAAGDVNGDGFADLLIGATRADEGGTARGAAYVVFGKAGGFGASVALSGLNGSNGFKLSGVANGDATGSSVSAAGDVNGDGFADLLIGAEDANEGGTNRGAAYVVFGQSGGFGASVALSGLNGSNGFKLSGIADNDQLSYSVSGAGDVNGDGFADLLIGANGANEGGTNRGAAYVVFGKPGSLGASVVALSGLNGSDGFKLSGIANNDYAGRSVSAAGDVNGDGFADLLIGASSADEGGTDRGAAYVVFGQPQVKVKFTAGGKVAQFTDYDGDLVTVKVTKGSLSQRDFTFSSLGAWLKLDLATKGALVFGGTNVTVTVKKAGAGDGKMLFLGAIDARGLDLGSVTIPGDLGQLDAGDTNFKTPAVKSLTVGSLAAIAGATQVTTALQKDRSDIVGPLGKLTVKGTMRGAINVTGGIGANIGSVFIGGNLDGNLFSAGYDDSLGLIRAGGNIGPVIIKGSIFGGEFTSGIIAGGKLGKVSIGGDFIGKAETDYATISALGDFAATTAAKAVAIAGLTVKGNVTNARILAGYTASTGAANPNASIGAVSVGGNWQQSSIAAGVDDGFVLFGFGLADSLITGDTQPALIATIASVTIKGTAIGSPTASVFHYGIVAERVGALKVGALKFALTKGTANDILIDTTNNDFRVLDFA